MNITEKRKPYWLFYYSMPALFGILAIYLFISIFDKNMFCAGDGWLMQYTATEYTRQFWQNVFHGSWTMIDFTVGEGLDPWFSMSYYGLTDPMSLPFAFCTHETLPFVFGIITLLKLFLSGIAFGWYASTKSNDDKAVAMGALVYTFSGFLLFWFFCPGIMSTGYLFPMLLYAMDRAFDKKKYVMFAGLTAFAYITNYYAGAAVSFMLMAYAIMRILCDGNWDKTSFFGYCKIVLAHIIGIASAAFIMLPVFIVMMGGARGSSSGYHDSMLWFNWEYYVDLLISFFTPFNNAKNYWIAPYKSLTHFLCLAAPALLLFLTHKTEKKAPERLLKWALLFVMTCMCVPFFSKLMNMWMYPTHRWAFAFALVIGMIVVWAIPKFESMSWKIKTASAALLIGGAAASLLNMYTRAAIVTIVAAIVTSLIMLIKPRRLTAYIACCVSIVMFIFATFVGNAYGAQFAYSDIAQRQNSEIYAAVDLSEEELNDFVRVSITDDITAGNTGSLLGYKTTTAAWNVALASINRFNGEANAFPNAEVDWWADGMDDRTALQTLAGTKYFITTKKQDIFAPYGFEFDHSVEIKPTPKDDDQTPTTYYVYTNPYNPGVGYLYNETLSYDAFMKLDIASRQLALMKYAVIDNTEQTKSDVSAFEIPVDIQEKKNCIVLTADIPEGYEVYLSVDKVLQTENLNKVQVNGYQYWQATQKDAAAQSDESNEYDSSSWLVQNYATVVAFSEDAMAIKTMRASRPHAHLSSTNTVRTVCLGHKLTGKVTIKIYYIDKFLDVEGISLHAMQTSEYATSAQKLMQNSWSNVAYSQRGSNGNFISGTINAKNDGVFQLAVPYHTGWKAYVDGKETEVFPSGVKYMGINVTAGEHNIRFEYVTPGLIPGAIISVLSLICLLIWFAYEHEFFAKRKLTLTNEKVEKSM